GFVATPSFNAVAEAHLAAAEGQSGEPRSASVRDADRACRTAVQHGRRDTTGLPHAARCQGTLFWLKGKRGEANHWWRANIAAAERMGMRYELVRTHLEMGARLTDRVHLERASAVAAQISAAWDLARAEALLADT